MNKKIFCVFLKCFEQKQDFQSYPGKLGKKIYNSISKKAWMQWIEQQTILINEKKLNLMNADNYEYLEKKMINFLFKNNKK